MDKLSDPGERGPGGRRFVFWLPGALMVLAGLWLAMRGAQLISLGGSWYYLIAGAGLVVAGVLNILRKPVAMLVMALVTLGTVAWAFWEAGANY
ncbi:glucose dehydrogenase [Pseudogemmobacter bohemicus]|uniref:glucose dehydrogenase n=1 Tax=Pseudogemmobacter bohemicus TaxID=2250708 RepID=UPI0018E4E5BB|nr:glucose dehydrogenase [Pseudogemmobacter bohemicus]